MPIKNIYLKIVSPFIVLQVIGYKNNLFEIINAISVLNI